MRRTRPEKIIDMSRAQELEMDEAMRQIINGSEPIQGSIDAQGYVEAFRSMAAKSQERLLEKQEQEQKELSALHQTQCADMNESIDALLPEVDDVLLQSVNAPALQVCSCPPGKHATSACSKLQNAAWNGKERIHEMHESLPACEK